MSLVSLYEIHEGRGGGDEIASKELSRGDRTRRYRAVCSSPWDGPDAVIAGLNSNSTSDGTSVGPLGSPHPVLTNAWLMRRRVENFAKSKGVFLVTLSYSTDPIVAPNGNPASDPAQISWATETYSRLYDYDTAATTAAGVFPVPTNLTGGNPLMNSAGQVFVPPPSAPDAYWVCTVKKNVTQIPTWILGYRNAVNQDNFTLDGVMVNRFCGWMKAIKIGTPQIRNPGPNQTQYRPLEFTIAVKDGHVIRKLLNSNGPPAVLSAEIDDDWKTYILDKGNIALTTNNGNPNLPNYGTAVPVLNADGSIARSPQLLNGKGTSLASQGVTPTQMAQYACYRAYLLKNLKPFGVLPLT